MLESYKYLGLGTVVERDHPQNNVNLTTISQTGGTGDAGDQYTGLDRFGRVVEQNWYDASTRSSTDDFKYSYDRDSNVLSRQNALDSIFSESYGYDNLNQLTGFSRGTHTQSWTPDALGNFTGVTTDGTTQTRTANQQNEITSISGAGTVTYDANGNTTADGSGNTYVYDAWNRLVAVKNGGTTVASYGYNGLGERTTETHGTATTDLYYSSSWQVLEERIGGQLQARNVWSPVYVNALVLRDQSSQNNGVLDQRLYVQQDANWNVTALVDINGNVMERYVYDPYGAVTVLTPTWAVGGSSAYNWLYFLQGERFDLSLGLGDFHGRVWSVTLQRFLQVDPLGLGPDNNDYRGEGDNPTNATDPSGLAAEDAYKPMMTKAQWVDVARKQLAAWPENTGDDALANNKKRSAFYGRMFQNHSKELKWPGMAAYASNNVGTALTRAAQGSGRLKQFGLKLESVFDLLAAGNRDVFEDVAWQFAAYDAAGGACGNGFKEIEAHKDDIPPLMYEGWMLIKKGVEDANHPGKAGQEILDRNKLFAKHEQLEVLQPIFDDHRDLALKMTALISTQANAGFKGSTPSIAAGVGDFGDPKERWEWIQNGFIPGWVEWQMKDPKGAEDFLKKVIKDGK